MKTLAVMCIELQRTKPSWTPLLRTASSTCGVMFTKAIFEGMLNVRYSVCDFMPCSGAVFVPWLVYYPRLGWQPWLAQRQRGTSRRGTAQGGPESGPRRRTSDDQEVRREREEAGCGSRGEDHQ